MKLSFAPLALALALPVIGCASNTAEEDSASDDAAVSAAASQCSSAKYNEALGFYKKAVAGANARARAGECEWDDVGYKFTIANNAEKAVATCGAFKNVIKTSRWADKLRASLEGTLTHRIVTGAVDPADWKNLPAALVGVSLEGGLGHSDYWTLSFAADGRGTLQTHEMDAEGNESWPEKPITWSVVQRDGKTFVKITGQPQGGAPVSYEYLVGRQVTEGDVLTTFERQGDWNDAFPATERFYDSLNECGG